MDTLFVMMIFGAVVFAIVQAKKSKAKARAAWQAVAREHRLDLAPGGMFAHPSMRGIHDGYRVTVDVVTRGGGKSSKTYTRYRVHFTSLGEGLRLTREVPVVSAIGKMFGGQDLEVGDTAFDDKVVVRAKSERLARAYLTPGRRRAIEKFLSSHKNAVITERNATFETYGVETRSAALERGLRLLVELANQLDPADGGTTVEVSEPRGDALADVAAVVGGAAVAKLREEEDWTLPALTEEPPRMDDAGPGPREPVRAPDVAAGLAPIAIGSVLPSRDEPDEAADAPAPPEAPAPPAPPLDMPEVGSIAPAEESAESGEHAADESVVTARQQDVCEALFAEDGGLSRARETFAAQYEGLFVHWTGELRSARHYYSDLVFGNDPGTRAEMVVARVASGILGEREIVAVVQLPDGLDTELSPRVGEEVTIEGDLASMDPFMRQVFVRNASIVS